MDFMTAIWVTPLPMLLLCARQQQWTANHNIMTLEDKETIDEMEKPGGKNGI